MSGIEIIGLISSIITLVDTAGQIYKAIKNAENLPPAFEEAARRLPLIHSTLKVAQDRLTKTGDTATFEALKPTVENIKKQAESLTNILQEIALHPNGSKLHRYRVVVRRLGKGSQVEDLMKSMLGDVQLVAENQAIRAATEAQMTELLEQVQALSPMASPPETPVPKDYKAATVSYFANGQQFNNVGSGTQNNNSQGGRQYFAQSMDFRAD
ncbi:hypothetical protein THAR02_01445 [Trichoderma harzianum]|uniref:NACHT-NTPase and P-loop NTPases N-terminal domain-containing protein n=1 Tax=Trichoderma harzianum TaxID=5544 RepID=A0A0G0A2C3_TRIHA|nr:hypothetical protein THAR02_01445 [Trichoderma harzianum]